MAQLELPPPEFPPVCLQGKGSTQALPCLFPPLPVTDKEPTGFCAYLLSYVKPCQRPLIAHGKLQSGSELSMLAAVGSSVGQLPKVVLLPALFKMLFEHERCEVVPGHQQQQHGKRTALH